MSKNKRPAVQFTSEPQENADDFDDLVETSPELEDEIEEPEVFAAGDEPPEGWHGMKTAPMVGTQIIVSITGRDNGTRAYYRRTRRQENGRWVLNGKWTEPVTGALLDFEPRFWKEIG